jgi:hypothetical protein
MRRASTRELQRASRRAFRWLAPLGRASGERLALCELGRLLCARIAQGVPGPGSIGTQSLELPTTAAFLRQSREQLMAVVRQIALAPWLPPPEGAGERRCWAELYGTLAASYARSGDVAAVAAIVRAAAHLWLADAWLDEAQAWLLDQQAAPGHFGLVSRELAHMRANTDGCDEDEDVCLRLTVEVLWAICEIVAARSQRAGRSIGVVEAAA